MTDTDTDLLHLHRQIVLRPDDLDLRGVHADRLEDLGRHERAEIIRVQLAMTSHVEHKPRSITVSLHGCPHQEWQARWRELCDRNKQLLQLAHDHAWATFPAWVSGWRWHNGFPDRLTCTCADWERSGPALVLQHPVAQVTISDKEPHRHVDAAGEAVYVWVCYPGDFYATEHQPDHITSDLFALLPPESFDGRNACIFRTRQTAIDALGAAALSQARRDARLIAPCEQCQGAGHVSPGKLLPAGGFDCTCPDCQGKGWRTVES